MLLKNDYKEINLLYFAVAVLFCIFMFRFRFLVISHKYIILLLLLYVFCLFSYLSQFPNPKYHITWVLHFKAIKQVHGKISQFIEYKCGSYVYCPQNIQDKKTSKIDQAVL